ncbi:PEP-CTERM sorting domain-containing protein [Rariglobus hedericola]|uniref:PEP-CTERM sorting domain-containing protein n=1 Tax=Rariglobus hedericola TaxID=2597822 RepID=A0A556QSJ8_9BACT|nr:PEP-CTERM sorting domain-containing protein [Rariglobus hedericola]TSJ79602.1 PEP-CTERM sorting domain-containing protein [Rariglobus hedericola]
MNTLHRLLALPVLALTVATANAGTFAEINLVDNSLADWTGIVASATNTGAGPVDQIFVSNNDTRLFILITFKTNTNILTDGFRLNIDSDGNANTGFHTYGTPSIGSEVLFEGDTAYRQADGVYSTGTSAPFSLLIGPYNQAVAALEFGIVRTAMVDSTPIFQSGTINLATYFESPGSSSLIGPINYTFASAVPEPSTYAALAGMGVLTLAFFRRRR